MTVREIIEELESYAQHYGDGTTVVIDIDEGPSGERDITTISAGPNLAGDPPYIRIA